MADSRREQFTASLSRDHSRMLKTLVLLASLMLSVAGDGGDLDSVLSQVFDKNDPNNGQNGNAKPAQPGAAIPCKTKDNRAGECVIYYLCNENHTISTDGADIIDIRLKDGPCESYLDICCEIPDKREPESAITPPPVPQHQGCGWRNPNGVGFRTTGDVNHETKFGEFPWMVAILRLEPVNPEDPNSEVLNIYVAGGSLIHPSVVLTVAHHVAQPQRLKARAGEWDTQTVKEIYPFQDREVAKVELHKDFNKHTLFYDIALLFLSAPMSLAPNVGLACLPAQGQRAAAGGACFASGWGKDQFGATGRYQSILKRVAIPVVDRRTCEKDLRKTRLGSFFELHSSFMCAGGVKGQDTCSGDGGSPLVCPIEYEPDRYEQVGIVSWGIGCGADGTPGVYTDVANLRDWIDNLVRGKAYKTQEYTA